MPYKIVGGVSHYQTTNIDVEIHHIILVIKGTGVVGHRSHVPPYNDVPIGNVG